MVYYEMKYWLMKSEPEEFSIDALKKIGEEPWSGVRNFQARNYMKDEMQLGDQVLFYHSSCPVPGVYGLAKVSHLAEPDLAQFDKKSKYYDARASKEKPWWYGVRVKFVKKFKKPVTLEEIKKEPSLKKMTILQRPRLSVSPVTAAEYKRILSLAQ